MSSDVICGSCMSPLAHPTAPCRTCGAQPHYPSWAKPHKSPALAAALAIVPGLGHLYLGEYRKFAGILGATGLLQFLGFDMDLTGIGVVLGVPMEVGGVGLWLYSIFDAYYTARRLSR